jgi:hypothetical protein
MPAEDPNPRTPDDNSPIQGKNWLTSKIVDLILRLTFKCDAMTHLLSEEMDHPLPLLTRVKMRGHFLMCCYCERYKENLHFIRRTLRSSAPNIGDGSAEALTSAEKERLKRVLRDQSPERLRHS